ncbi:hypothetical protein AALB_3805 [Agarivorans albus MKT 106]|uniref:Uncharacterized protein n=1 Tax=Agarivorans albus MKT 106 TaxID=1331007 RepID=R9PQZ4_AGAAL|nr:hypothetical protein AALB_3805 [Agarivorans albus MKT 106]
MLGIHTSSFKCLLLIIIGLQLLRFCELLKDSRCCVKVIWLAIEQNL